jgi:hypothetical protein
MVGDNEHAADDRQQGGNCEALKNIDVHRLKWREYKHRQNKQYGEQRKQPVVMLLPQAAHVAYRVHTRRYPMAALLHRRPPLKVTLCLW